MKLKFIEIELNWPEDVFVQELRLWLLKHLSDYGQPLRWSITDTQPSSIKKIRRKLKIEAVVVVNS